MKTVKLYGRPNCRECRETLKFFAEKGVEVEAHDVTKERMSREVLEYAVDEDHVDDAFEHRCPFYHLFGLDRATPPKRKAVRMLLEEPGLMRVPLVVQDGHTAFGWDREGYEHTFEL